jgi:hypothetical protein
MMRATFTIVALCGTAAAAPLVTYESPCECRDTHGKHRWSEKNDPSSPPREASAIQAVTPSDIFNWQGPTEYLRASSERIAAEQKWYALAGRVIELRAEKDGDLHIALADATGDKPGVVVAEIPAKHEWCELRKIVFGWTEVQLPFRVRSGRKLKLTQPVIITVIGKAFFDIGHAPAEHSNRRTDLQGYAAWEIHHVMSECLGQFYLLGTIRFALNVLNANEAAHFSQHKHGDRHEFLAAFVHQVLSKIWTDALVMFNVVAHHWTLGEEHLLSQGARFPSLRILHEWMLRIWRDLLLTFNCDAQTQRIVLIATQP